MQSIVQPVHQQLVFCHEDASVIVEFLVAVGTITFQMLEKQFQILEKHRVLTNTGAFIAPFPLRGGVLTCFREIIRKEPSGWSFHHVAHHKYVWI